MNDAYFYNMPYYRTNISYTMPGCYTSNRIYQDMIAKHSFNLIDLIEVGDYVNGKEVEEIDYEDEIILGFPIYTPDGLFNTIECYAPLEEFEIENVVTHEQFKSVMYEV